jgi:hypothetical protein
MTTNSTTDFDFNTAGGQRDVIPANTVVTLQMKINPGAAGDGGWLTRSFDGGSEGLDCEYTVVDGEYAKRKVFQRLTLHGTTEGHAEAGQISRNTLRAIIESARGILPNDRSEIAQQKRRLAGGWKELDGVRFIARLGVRPAKDGYPAKNVLLEVLTPERTGWQQVEQAPVSSAAPGTGPEPSSSAPNAQPPANAVARPQWAE